MYAKSRPRKRLDATPLADYYVLHVPLSGMPNHWYAEFSDAFDAFKKACKCHGSAAMWRGPSWTRLYTHGEYPETLSQPYL